MIHRLSHFCSPTLFLVLKLQNSKDFGDPLLLRKRIKKLLERTEKLCSKDGISIEKYELAKFALIAFLDETINSSEWPQKSLWQANPLHLELFNLFDAGNEFFKRLEILLKRPRNYPDVLEVYYLCMVLGFKGKYLVQEKEKLRILINDTYNELYRLGDLDVKNLSPHGPRKEEIVPIIRDRIPPWVLCVVATAIGFIVFLIMNISISNVVNNLIQEISQIR